MGGRRRLRDLLADRGQAQQRATRLRQRPGIGGVEEVLRNRHRDRVVDGRDQLDLIGGPPGRVQRQPGVARREHCGQALGQRVPDAVACLVQQGASAGRRDGALERLDQPVTISARAQGDAVQPIRRDPVDRLEHDLDPLARRGLARDGQPVGLDHRFRGLANSRQTAPSAMARTTPMIG